MNEAVAQELAFKKSVTESLIRIAIVVSHPIQHFAPWYCALAAIKGVTLKVFYCSMNGAEPYYDRDFGTEIEWDIPLLDGYEWALLKSPKKIKNLGFWAVDNPEVREALAKFRPDAVMTHGYSHRTCWRAAGWCKRNHIPAILYSDSNAKALPPFWKRFAKRIIVKKFYRMIDGALFVGDNNYDYHVRYGLSRNRLFRGALPIDTKRILGSVDDILATRLQIRRKHNIPEDAFLAIFSGKLISRKCPDHLVNAIEKCRGSGKNIWAILVGEGSERAELEKLLEKSKNRNIVLTGFVNQGTIGKYYSASDILVVPSAFDPHPLILPEAGCFSLPVIASDRLGCIGKSDTARVGENALIYPHADIDALQDCILRLHGDKALYESMSKAAKKISDSQDVTVAALQLKEAAGQLMKMGCKD